MSNLQLGPYMTLNDIEDMNISSELHGLRFFGKRRFLLRKSSKTITIYKVQITHHHKDIHTLYSI